MKIIIEISRVRLGILILGNNKIMTIKGGKINNNNSRVLGIRSIIDI